MKFGTDGIRCPADCYPMNQDGISKLVFALVSIFNPEKVLIGYDTRASGVSICDMLSSCFLSYGVTVDVVGIAPTPAISFLTQRHNYDLGIVISASHNPYRDNGIKIFDNNGSKLSSEQESAIEKKIFDFFPGMAQKCAIIKIVGECSRYLEEYIDFIMSTAPELDLSGFRLVVDDAHGALSSISSRVLKSFGAKVISVADQPNGFNINDNCGAAHPEYLSAKTKEACANIGISFDGDGDRVAICDENGDLVDGDHLLGFLAKELHSEGKNSCTAINVMSNGGLADFLKNIGVEPLIVSIPAGDKYIACEISSGRAQFGGERSGHIIMGEYLSTGDGLLTAVQILKYLIKSKKRLQEIVRPFVLFPFILKSIPIADPAVLEGLRIKELINSFSDRGRILVRKSGTEEVVRILVECKNSDDLENIMDTIVSELQR